jgi:hypothetical protein
MSNLNPLSNTLYDILIAMGEDAEFLYDTIETYIRDAQQNDNKELVSTWEKIKADRLNHVNMLKDALEKEIHGE